MSKIVIVVIICISVSFPANAQTSYQLREPTAMDFLRIAAEAIGGCNWSQTQPTSSSPWNLCAYLLDKVETGFGDSLNDAPYDLLIKAYDSLQPGSEWDAPGNSYLWHKALIMAWLRDKAIDLDKQTEFTVNDMTIQVKPRDFNVDGVNEYVLEVESSFFSTYFVLMRKTDGSYQSISTSLPYHDGNSPYWDFYSNYLHEIAFDDFNADGLPEWFLAFTGADYRGDDLGELYLLEWRDGEIKPVTNAFLKNIPGFNTNANRLPDETIQDGFVFRNLDDDASLELQRIDISSDNWNCLQTSITTYDWDSNAHLYMTISDGIRRPHTANCLIDEAENALSNQNYSAAAHLYEYARTLPLQVGNQPEDSTFDTELPQFIQLRMAQAYLLNREYEAADKLLDALAKPPMASPMLDHLRDVLLAHREASPAETCTALYNLFEAPIVSAYNYGTFQKIIGTDLGIGLRSKFYGDFIGNGNPADPAFAGCNVPGIIDPYLDKDFYSSQGSPADLLQASGFKVSDSLQADFNGDGRSDSLIWFEAHIPAVLLLDEGNNQPLTVSRVDIPHPGKYVTATTVPLPDNAGTALVLFRANEGLPSYFGGMNCGESASVLGVTELWQFIDNHLTFIQSSSWCDDYPTVNTLFETTGGKSVFYVHDQDKVTHYVWNSETRRYTLPTAISEDATGTQTPPTESQQPPSNEELYRMLGDGASDYYERLDQQMKAAKNVEAELAILDGEINADYMDYPYPLQYWKATILQKAGRDNDALAEYLSLYEAAPETVWGRLAAAHFELINKE